MRRKVGREEKKFRGASFFFTIFQSADADADAPSVLFCPPSNRVSLFHSALSTMGGGNAQKSAISRAKNAAKAASASKGIRGQKRARHEGERKANGKPSVDAWRTLLLLAAASLLSSFSLSRLLTTTIKVDGTKKQAPA